MKLIKDLWHGDVPLVMTYWVYGIIFGNIAGYSILYLMDGAIVNDMISGVLILYIVFIALLVHILVSIWRSSSNYISTKKSEGNSAFWGYAAKVMVALAVLRVFIAIMQELYYLQF